MGAEDAVKALQGLPKQFHTGINFDELKKFDRWEIIKYVRNIATAAVKDDVELSPDLAKFARHGRSNQQVAAGLKRKAEEVFKKQTDLLDGLDVDCKLVESGSHDLGGSKVSIHTWGGGGGAYCISGGVCLFRGFLNIQIFLRRKDKPCASFSSWLRNTNQHMSEC